MKAAITKLLKKVIPHHLRPKQLILSFLRAFRGDTIYDGLFRDVIYGCEAFYSVTLPKYLGVYEVEIYPVLESFLHQNFDCYVDIGAAEGYYAVGLASRLPTTINIIAFETEESARDLLIKNLELNHLRSRVEVLGNCSKEDIIRLTEKFHRLCLIVDVEGYEAELLSVQGLENVTMLVEIHDTRDFILNTFNETHRITFISQKARTIDSFKRFHQKWLGILGKIPIPFLDEGRPVEMDNAWAVLIPQHF